MGGNRLTQFRHARHGRVLVGHDEQGFRRLGQHWLGAEVVGKALAEIDRLMFVGEPRHRFETIGAIGG